MSRNEEGHPSAGRNPANKTKFSLFGTDTTTKQRREIELVAAEEPAIGTVVTGTDKATGKPATIKVQGRNPAN